MKKLLFTLSALSVMSYSAFAQVRADVTVVDNGTPETAYVLDGIEKGKYYVVRRQGADWSNYYFYISTPSITSSSSGGSSLTYSTSASDGFNPGIRANYYFMLDANNKSFATTSSAMFNFSGNGSQHGASTSVGYHLMSKDGSDVEFKVVSPTDNTALANWYVSLGTDDGNGAMNADQASAKGERGRAFSVGDNVTAKANSVTITGKLTTTLEEGFTDSLFTIKSGGTVESARLAINGSNVLIEKDGVFETVDSSEASTVSGNSKFDINGSAIFESGIQLWGGTTTIGSTGEVSVGGLRLKGGSLVVNGKLKGITDSHTFAIASDGGTLSVGAGADISKVAAMNMEDGITNIASDVTLPVLRTSVGKTATLTVGNGYTLTAEAVNFLADSNTTINGSVLMSNGATINTGTTLTIASGTTVFGNTESSNSISNTGTLNINKGAIVRIKSKPNKDLQVDGGRVNINGIVNVDGGKVYLDVNEASKNAVAGVISGTTTLKNGASIEFSKTLDRIRLGIAQGGILSVSADSEIIGNSIVFTRTSGTSDYKQESKLILSGGDSFTGQLIVLRRSNTVVELAAGQDYQFTKLDFHHYAGGVTDVSNGIIFDLNGAKSLTIGAMSYFSGVALGDLVFKDFREGLVKIENLTDSILEELNTTGKGTIGNLTFTMSAVDGAGKVIAGDWSLKDGFLSHSAFATAVPEPAEWAMIFGMLALGLAMYRRRK
ncbi:MAG: hypothetical protein E7036_02070 [Opitutales bacterium]|nr:hypothetical protein [Opitutales bacterium]